MSQSLIKRFAPVFTALFFLGFGRSHAAAADSTYFGFTPFPYDITPEAVSRTNDVVAENSTIYAFHFDDGIPWREALENRPFPPKIREDWTSKRESVPRGHQVYVALAPLAKDRKNLAPASDGSEAPRGFSGTRFDDDDVKKAFLTYARRAVETFQPDYLNLGIEAGELAGKDRRAWERFEKLYAHVRSELKKDYPELPMGISFSLHALYSREDIADRARSLVDNSDYIGLSFYPYASSFSEKVHRARPLPPPPDQWREPLRWVREYSDKPIAICETGYSTVDVRVPAYDLFMEGSTALQERYVEDLGRIAARDDYLFVVWFLAIDYDALYEKIPEGDGSNRIWRNIGFLDKNLQPKPAWDVWQRVVRGEAPPPSTDAVEDRQRPKDAGLNVIAPLGFTEERDLFQSPDRVELSDEAPPGAEQSMRWSFDYEGEWHWATRSLKRERMDGATHVSFWIKSDRAAPMFFQVEEDGGEAFFAMVHAEEEWQEVRFELDRLDVDPQKREDGRLDASKLSQILIADNAGTQDAEGKRTIWLADLALEGRAGPAPDTRGAIMGTVQLGFTDERDLFQSPDRVELRDEAPPGAEQSMRWSFDYEGEWHWATRSLKRERMDGATHVSFWIKSDRATPMFFQVEEDGGEAFFAMVHAEEEWQEVRFELDQLDVDPQKREDGRLDVSKLSQILIADNAGTQGAEGKRTIWLAELTIHQVNR